MDGLENLASPRSRLEWASVMANPFKGNRLLGGLGGCAITSDMQRYLLQHTVTASICVLLSGGQGFSIGDGCTPSARSRSRSATISNMNMPPDCCKNAWQVGHVADCGRVAWTAC